MDREGSEFGKGLVICLVKFSEHVMTWPHTKRMYEELRDKYKREGDPKADSFWSEGMAVEMWFNGASDHLYEIEVPAQYVGTKLEDKVNELRELGLGLGHCYGNLKKGTEKDVVHASDLCREIALMLDEDFGLEPDLGKF